MPKLFTTSFSLIAALIASHASAADAGNALCPQPEQENKATEVLPEASADDYHQAMATAQLSARERLDWVSDDSIDNACGGYYREPANPNPQQHMKAADADTRMSAETVERNPDGFTLLQGDVEFYQGSMRFRCDNLRYSGEQGYSELNGDIQLRQPGLLMMADKAVLDSANQHSEFHQAEYVLHQQQLHGKAEQITAQGSDGGFLALHEASFTLCPPNAEHWAFTSKDLEFDIGKGWGKARHAVFEIKDIPVLYIPYLDFPIDDRRKTGFLWPSISGGNGTDIAVPYYINLAPNYDMTYIGRYNSDHGYQHGIEGRYKHKYSEWRIGGTWIGNDKEVGEVEAKDDASLDQKRWLGLIEEQGRFNPNWSTMIDYQAVSDVNYFRDWGTVGLDVQKSLNIKRQAELKYSSDYWLATTTVVDYQRLELDSSGKELQEDYRLLPQINLLYRHSNRGFNWQPQLFAQYSYFDHEERTRGQRLYLQPGLSYPMRWRAAELIPTVKMKHISYQFNNSNTADEVVNPDAVFEGNHQVSIPSISLDSRLYLERDLQLGDGQYLQTLQPRLYYYYAEFEKQNDLPLFDSGENAFSYNQLFRDRRFSGFDRIGDANQLSWGISSTVTSKTTGRRLLDIGIGQILYNRERDVSLLSTDRDLQIITPTDTDAEKQQKQAINAEISKKYYRSASDIAVQSNWFINDNQRLLAELIWDPYQDQASEGRLMYHHRAAANTFYNLGYRYKREIPLLDTNGELFDNDIEQLDASVFAPINRQWHGFARWHYDLIKTENIENMIGLQYEGCCWGVKFAYQRERKTFDENQRIADTVSAEYQNSWLIQFELKGLGGITNTVTRLLEESIQGYRNEND